MESLRKRLKLTWYRYIPLQTHKHSAADKTDFTPQSVALLPWGCQQISEYTGFGVGVSEKVLWPHCPHSRVFLKTGRNIWTVDPKSILRIHCLDVSLGCWGPWQPAGNSALHSDPHPSLESHGDPVKHLYSLYFNINNEPKPSKTKLEERSLSLPSSLFSPSPSLVCVCVFMWVCMWFLYTCFAFPRMLRGWRRMSHVPSYSSRYFKTGFPTELGAIPEFRKPQ